MRKTVTTVVLTALLLIVCGSHILADDGDPDVYTSKTHGFKIKRPGSGWSFQPKLSTDRKTLDLYMRQSGSTAFVLVKAASTATKIEPKALRDSKWNDLLKETRYSNLKKEQGKIAGQKAPGLSLDTKAADGSEYTLCQFYLEKDGILYSLQCTALKKDFKTLSPVFGQILQSFSFVAVSEQEQTTLQKLAARCGSEIEWFTDWDSAAKRAQKERKLILVTVQFYGGFSLQELDFARIGPFTDPDLIELARERFIVLKLAKNTDAPFRSEYLYGMGSMTFGKAMLFVTPDGKVVGDAFSFEPFYLYDYALEVLANNPEFTGKPLPKGAKAIELARAYLRRGELKLAAGILSKMKSAEGCHLRASLYRRLRQGDKALKALEAARSRKKSGMEADLTVDEAVILLRMGKLDKAAAQLSKVIKKHPKSERIPEAMYWLGACRRALAKGIDSEGWWEKLVESYVDDRWAWKAASSLIVAGSKGTRLTNLDWPDKAVLNAVRDREQEARNPQDIKIAGQEAVSFLLKAQRADGSWITPPELGGLSQASVPLRDAKIALCAMALLPYRSDSKASRAVNKALKFLLESHSARKKTERQEFYMDYDVWSHSCMLWFLAKCLDAGVGQKRALTAAMAELVSDLQQKQRPDGGWSYYISASLGQGAKADTRSISFVTAGVVLSLLEAKKSGVAIPAALLKKALDCLEKMRNSNGSFIYFSDHRNEAARDRTLPGCAGRVPLCELALSRGKRSSLERIRQALDIFLRYRHELSKQRGKALMHTGRHGQGSHYLLFDYANAAAAVRELPAGEREKYKNTVLQLVLDARTEDGSYLDSPLLGHCYGTSMALLTFQYLK